MSRWTDKATSLWLAWQDVTGATPPTMRALTLCLAQCEHETNCGDAWPMAHDEGATDLRACTPAEIAAINAGQLHKGYWLYADNTWGPAHKPGAIGIMQTDSHPGGISYAVWFAAFDDDRHGFGYFLHVIRRMVPSAILADTQASPSQFAQALYLSCYYEGVHTGARRCGARALPLNSGEQANVDDYARAVARLLATIELALVGWVPPGQAIEMAPQEIVEPSAGIETAPAIGGGDGGDA
jgi:hypothetical protein